MPQTKTRVVGSGFTTLNFDGKPIAWLESFTDSGQRPIVQPEPVTSLGDAHPKEIATTRVLQAGTLTLSIRELWNAPVWYQLAGLSNTPNIIDVYKKMAAMGPITCQMVISPPGGKKRSKVYHGCIVTAIDDSETVAIGTLTVAKSLTVMYTHTK